MTQNPSARRIRIDVATQWLTLEEQGQCLFSAPVSTGAAGVGFEEGSGKTPTGRFAVCSRHGLHAPLNTVFRGRIPVGLYDVATAGEDAILTRILCLEGLEPQNANTRARYIYLHGTPDVARIGTPASHGCIRLKPADMAALFELVPTGTEVIIG